MINDEKRNERARARVILGIDPGLASTGYGVIHDYGTHCTYRADGTIRTASNEPLANRLAQIADALEALVRDYRPHIAAVEGIYFSKNASSAIPVAQAIGVVMLTLHRCGVTVREYAPQHIKRTITDYGRATKEQVRMMVRALLANQFADSASNHAVDGLAIALSCGHTRVLDYVS